MRKYLLLILLISVFGHDSAFAIEPITDANSILKLTQQIESLPKGKRSFNITFKSKIDNTLQPMLIKVPDAYTKTKSWPLLVVLHGLGDNSIVVPTIGSMVQIGPFGRGDQWYYGIGEQDVFECLELAKKIFNIDPDRIYLSGFSMGGSGTFELGLKYPDIWAACVPVCGNIKNLSLVENGYNLPFWINAGSKDMVVPAKRSKRAYDKAVKLGFKYWKYTEYDGMGHSFWINWKQIEKWLLLQNKTNSPANIMFVSEKPAKAYWAEITKIDNSEKSGNIVIETALQTIKLKTSNISSYILYLKDAPINLSQELTIIENDKQIFKGLLSTNGIFDKELYCRKIDKACTN